MTEPMTIDVVSDVVCPWCYVGKRRLERALVQQSDEKVEIRWLPFFLDPSVPAGGIPRIDYITRKFGTSGKITPAHERLVGIGAGIGIDFKFERIERQPNTLDAHRVIGWAQEAGRASPVVNRLFELFFTEGADIGAHDVLIEVGKFAGTRCQQIATGPRGRSRCGSRRASGHSGNECRDRWSAVLRVRQETGSRGRTGRRGLPRSDAAGARRRRRTDTSGLIRQLSVPPNAIEIIRVFRLFPSRSPSRSPRWP